MSKKIQKGTLPNNHTPNDFQAYGPVAEKDGEFSNTKMCDFGHFSQESNDKNKFYHASVLKSKINNNWYTYFEWGRTGKTKDFQFAEFSTESAAQAAYEKQCHAKNDKRGVWVDICGHKTLQAKPKKDVYLVRTLAGRDTNIPDANTITNAPQVTATPIKTVASKKYDTQSESLLRDLIGGTVNYARSSMTTGVLPSQDAIDLARKILMQAQKEVSIDNKKGLRDLTYQLYSRIPKYKPRNTLEDYWLLNSNNIFEWQNDLDAYESALSNQSYTNTSDDFGDLSFDIKWIDPRSELGEFLYRWWPRATLNKHSYLNNLKIKNIWEIFKDYSIFNKKRQEIKAVRKNDRPLFQDEIIKSDLDNKANVHWLHHGSRSCNIIGILKEGIKIPNYNTGVQITGRLYGNAAYHADDIKKSAGYTSLSSSYWSKGSGSIRGRDAFMLINEVILGDIFIAKYGQTYSPPPSFHSVMGKAGTSGVMNNEFMVYDTNQVRLRYLVEFKA